MGIRTAQKSMHKNRRSYAPQYVTEGNTVRVVQAEPVPKRHRRLTPEQRDRLDRLNEVAERSASASLTLPLTIILIASMLVVLVTGYKYLCIKSSIDTHMDNVKSLETRLENLKTENDALERSIDTSVDLNHVYEVATKQLGMVPANKNNIIQYEKSESEYVRQYDEIPSAKH